jgi:hypothetical protein
VTLPELGWSGWSGKGKRRQNRVALVCFVIHREVFIKCGKTLCDQAFPCDCLQDSSKSRAHHSDLEKAEEEDKKFTGAL